MPPKARLELQFPWFTATVDFKSCPYAHQAGPHPSSAHLTPRNSHRPLYLTSQLLNLIDCIMADVATPPAAQAATADASASQGKQQIVKPEKPDEEKYKEDLAKAEKEHTAAQEKLVSHAVPTAPL